MCLMKLSAYHKARGDSVEWHDGRKHYDLVYMSRVFTDSYSKDYAGTMEIVGMVRGLDVAPEELAAFIKAFRGSKAGTPDFMEREDSEHEESEHEAE